MINVSTRWALAPGQKVVMLAKRETNSGSSSRGNVKKDDIPQATIISIASINNRKFR